MSREYHTSIAVKIAEGDPDAENELFMRFQDRIQMMVRIRLKGKASIEDQEDIISEIYQTVLLSLRKGRYDPASGNSLAAYIAGIGSNIVGQYFRRRKKERTIESDGHFESVPVEDDTLADMVENERDAKLRECLERLKPKYREILLLRIYEKKSIAEIAQQLELEPRRVSERIHYAFKLLLKECRKDEYFQYLSPFSK